MYMIVHCKHEGCYNNQIYEDEVTGVRVCPVTINPPKIFLFHSKPEAMEFFTEYMNDVDVIDHRCKNDLEEINHIKHCTCGVVELEDDGDQPILFYNSKNQIFLLEPGPQVYLPSHELKVNTNNLNLLNVLINKTKTLDDDQKRRYVELGKRCQKHL